MMLIRIVIATVCVFVSMKCYTQYIKSNCLGLGAYSGLHNDVFSQATNPASLSQIKDFSIGIFSERKYMLAQLSYYHLAVGIGATKSALGMTLDYFGAGALNDMSVSFTYSKRLAEKLALGARFHYFKSSISGYSHQSLIAGEAGLCILISDQLQTGFKFLYPSPDKQAGDGYSWISPQFSFGLGFEPSAKFFAGIEITKFQRKPVEVNAGVYYEPHTQFWTRLGITTSNSSIWTMAGTRWKNWSIGIAASFHQRLGATPGVMFIYQKPDTKTSAL